MAQDNNDTTKKVTTQLNSEKQATEILNAAIASLEEKTGSKITPARRKKFAENLLPALKNLGHEYLAAKADTITTELTKSLESKQTFFSRYFTRKPTVSTVNLEGIANAIKKEHSGQSTAAMEKKVEDSLRKNRLNDEQITAALSNFLTENKVDNINKLLNTSNKDRNIIHVEGQGTKTKITVHEGVLKNLNNKQLAIMRNINPQGFDAALSAASKAPATPKLTPNMIKQIEKENINPAVEAQKIEAAKKSPPSKTPQEIQEEYARLTKARFER